MNREEHSVVYKAEINQKKPKCYLSFTDGTNSTNFAIYRNFNWFQKKMLKWCFGLEYTKINE